MQTGPADLKRSLPFAAGTPELAVATGEESPDWDSGAASSGDACASNKISIPATCHMVSSKITASKPLQMPKHIVCLQGRPR